MGSKSSKNKKKKESAKDQLTDGPVKHRAAENNRVSEDEM